MNKFSYGYWNNYFQCHSFRLANAKYDKNHQYQTDTTTNILRFIAQLSFQLQGVSKVVNESKLQFLDACLAN